MKISEPNDNEVEHETENIKNGDVEMEEPNVTNEDNSEIVNETKDSKFSIIFHWCHARTLLAGVYIGKKIQTHF